MRWGEQGVRPGVLAVLGRLEHGMDVGGGHAEAPRGVTRRRLEVGRLHARRCEPDPGLEPVKVDVLEYDVADLGIVDGCESPPAGFEPDWCALDREVFTDLCGNGNWTLGAERYRSSCAEYESRCLHAAGEEPAEPGCGCPPRPRPAWRLARGSASSRSEILAAGDAGSPGDSRLVPSGLTVFHRGEAVRLPPSRAARRASVDERSRPGCPRQTSGSGVAPRRRVSGASDSRVSAGKLHLRPP